MPIARAVRIARAKPIATLLASCAWLIACHHAPPKPPPPPPPVNFSLTVSGDANPDSQLRPSPVVVRIYQLKDDAAFKDADFFALYDKEQATLAAALVSRQEFELAPGETRTLKIDLSPDARFVGAVAAFRDIRNADWRAQIGAQDKALRAIIQKNQVTVAVARSRIGFVLD